VLPNKRREMTESATETPSSFTTHERADGGDRRNDRRPQRSGPGGPRSDRPQGGDRSPRSDRPQGGDRGPRSDRPQGDRGPRTDRPPRPQGERAPRPQGERVPRPQGDRPPRPQGERAARPPRAEKPDQVAEASQTPTEPQVSQAPETGASESE
jgi:small subunit ribosomal protein S3